MYARAYVCMYAYVYSYVKVYMSMQARGGGHKMMELHNYLSIRVCIYVCMCVCMYAYT